jgi:hypothetical protein
MKKITLLLSVLFISVAIYAQQNNMIDVVYLKNGSILRGIIIEQVPNESIKLQTSDGNIFVYQTDEILKITKDTNVKQSRKQLVFGDNDIQQRKGYIGLSIGPSFGVGDVSELPVGIMLNLVDFGYLFTDNIGIAAKWYGTAHTESGISAGVGGLLAGLLFSTPISEKINFEGKALVGPGVQVLSYDGDSETSDVYFGYDLGISFRFNTSKKVSLLLNADYIGVYDYNSVNLTFGVAYRLK